MNLTKQQQAIISAIKQDSCTLLSVFVLIVMYLSYNLHQRINEDLSNKDLVIQSLAEEVVLQQSILTEIESDSRMIQELGK